MKHLITDSNLYIEATKNLKKLNDAKIPSIFIVTGLNSVGKTTFARELMRNFNFYQTIHLGIISKLLKLEHGFDLDDLENNATPQFHAKYLILLNYLIEHYYNQGVNTLIEGVQINPLSFIENNYITGGVILTANDTVIEKFGNNPDSRLNRKLRSHQLPSIEYQETPAFKKIINTNKSATFTEIVNHLNRRLEYQISNMD